MNPRAGMIGRSFAKRLRWGYSERSPKATFRDAPARGSVDAVEFRAQMPEHRVLVTSPPREVGNADSVELLTWEQFATRMARP